MVERLLSGETLGVDDKLVSENGLYDFKRQSDGNVVLYGPIGAVWATGTDGQNVTLCIMQSDGNFVLYNNNNALWATGTHNNPEAYLKLQNDQNVVIYNNNGQALWSTKTHMNLSTGVTRRERVSVGHMKARVKLQSNAKVFSKVEVTNANNAQGFTGGFAALFYDETGNIIDHTDTHKIGVTPDVPFGHPNREEEYLENVKPETFDEALGVIIILKYAPEVRWGDLERLIENAEAIGKTAAQIAALFA